MLNRENITALRLHRQHLIKKAGEKEYDELFRDISPVPTVYWTEPGAPPRLPNRADFDDYAYNFKLRARRDIVKGRFQNGTVGYVSGNNLELYACMYKKELKTLNHIGAEILEIIEREGPVNIGYLKELTGFLVKQITPELHRLQKAFLVFEDQADNEWDRSWYSFAGEFPGVNINSLSKTDAIKAVLRRFARRSVFFDIFMAESFYKLPLKELKKALDALISDGVLLEYNGGYISCADSEFLNKTDLKSTKSAFVMHRNDFLVKSNEHVLKKKFVPSKDEYPDLSVVYYILLDGEFRGYVAGNFKNGPFELEDIILDISNEEKHLRRDEVINALYMISDPKKSPLRRYNGKVL